MVTKEKMPLPPGQALLSFDSRRDITSSLLEDTNAFDGCLISDTTVDAFVRVLQKRFPQIPIWNSAYFNTLCTHGWQDVEEWIDASPESGRVGTRIWTCYLPVVQLCLYWYFVAMVRLGIGLSLFGSMSKDQTFFYHFDTIGSKKRTEIVRGVLKTTSLWRNGFDRVSIDLPQQDEAGCDCGVWMLICRFCRQSFL